LTTARNLLRRIRPWHIANLFVLVLLFTGLGAPPLLDQDGSRYPEVAREMLVRGDWITPTQNYIPFFHKPPLIYWLLMLSLRTFGESEFAARLVPTVCAVAGLGVVWWLATLTVGKHAARWAPPIMATMVTYFGLARLASMDMLLSVTLAAAFTAWWSGEKNVRKRTARHVLTGVMLGLAMLSKGPVALVLFVGAVGVYLIWSRQLSRSLMALGLPTLVGIAVAAPWFIAVQMRNPEFAQYFFVFQNVQRFTAIGYVDHPHPWHWFVPVAIGGAIFWSAFWPFGLVGWRQRWRDLAPDQRRDAIFLIAWAGFVLVFFSASSCKLASYILPMFWPLAVGSAVAARRALATVKPSVWLRLTLLSPVAAAVGGLVILLWWAGHQSELPSDELRHATTLYAILALPATLAFGGALRWRSVERRLVAVAVGAAIFLMALMPLFHAGIAHRKLGGMLPDEMIESARRGEWTLAQYKCYNASLCFYTHQRVVLIDFVRLEMSMGPDQPDGAYWFRQGEEAIDRLSEQGPLALLVRTDARPELGPDHGLTLVRKNHERRLLVNDAGLEVLNRYK
jgi:4-amino-4-deoxy-L-arabinose transferase-like glycosyltransferase